MSYIWHLLHLFADQGARGGFFYCDQFTTVLTRISKRSVNLILHIYHFELTWKSFLQPSGGANFLIKTEVWPSVHQPSLSTNTPRQLQSIHKWYTSKSLRWALIIAVVLEVAAVPITVNPATSSTWQTCPTQSVKKSSRQLSLMLVSPRRQ
jgi:hypothetical protein